jgi:hypothetical protein
VFTATLISTPAAAQPPPPSPPQDVSASTGGQTGQSSAGAAEKPDSEQSAKPGEAPKDPDAKAQSDLPVSLDKIKEALQQTPLLSLRTIDERPTFRVMIRERMKIEELLASLNFKSDRPPAGGIYMQEQQRIMFPAVDNPLVQPFAAFNQGELLTILVENLVGKYFAGRAVDAISKAERARAEAAAREEVRSAVQEYCNAQPHAGAGLAICSSVGR